MAAPHEVLTPREVKAIVDHLAGNFGPIEGDVARAFGDLVGRIIIDRVVGCRTYLGRDKGWCTNDRDGDAKYCAQHLEEIEVWKQAMLEAREQS